MAVIPRAGSMIITKTIIPSPPIQCVKLLQKRIENGRDSTSENIDAPVVVNPDDDSKNASTNEEMVPLKRYGNAPMPDKTSQERETARKPSLVVTFSDAAFFEIRYKNTDIDIDINDDHKNGSGDSS